MKIGSLLRYVAMLGAIATQCSCASEDGSPFPSRFRVADAYRFEFIAVGTFDYPANTKSGEAERLTWLSGYISQLHICPEGYNITARKLDHLELSTKHGAEEQG